MEKGNRLSRLFVPLLSSLFLFTCAPRRTQEPTVVVEEPTDTVVTQPTQEPYPEPTIIFEEEDIPTEAQSEEPVTKAPTLEYGYRVQILASTSERNAESFAAKAREQIEYPVYVEYIPPYHKVRVGDFLRRADAEACRDLLRSIGYPDAFVVDALVNVP